MLGASRRPGEWAPFALVAAVAAIAAALAPLAHPDLPSHLRIGEWILEHRRVPSTEPVAWTRMGEPYFAYSWLAQIAFTLAWRAAGATGLHVLHGVIALLAVLALVPLARAERWSGRALAAVAALHLGALLLTVPSPRPQALLFVAVPLVAGGLMRLSAGSLAAGIALMLGGSLLASNTHLFFPVTAGPLAYAFARRVPPRALALGALVIVAGWLLSPYGLRWVEVYELNLGANALFGDGSPIAELTPGFSRPHLPFLGILLVGVALTFVGSLAPGSAAGTRVVAPTNAAILAALAFYAVAVRLTLIGWLVLLPFAAYGVAALIGRGAAAARVVVPGAAAILLLALIIPGRWDHWSTAGLRGAGIAAPADPVLAPMAHHLRCAGGTLEGARIFTRFADGSYLEWALAPALVSVDTRTIFPDSVAVPEREVMRGGAVSALGPWPDAHLAVLRVDDPAVGAIDGDREWIPIGEVVPGRTGEAPTGWWARSDWWAAHFGAAATGLSLDARALDSRRAECPGEAGTR